MNYYIEGNPNHAEQIKDAFERLGYDVKNWRFNTGVYYTLNGKIINTNIGSNEYELILNSSEYNELELPKPHYDLVNFQPFDKVLGRDNNGGHWEADFFSRIRARTDSRIEFKCVKYSWIQCIPFNEKTKHLLGTIDMPDEMYINW